MSKFPCSCRMQSLVVHPCPTFEGMGSAAHQLRLFHAKYRPELVLKRGLHTVYLQAGKCTQFKMLCVLVAVSGTTRHRLPSNLSLVVVVCQPTTSSGSELLRRIQLKHCACQPSSTVLPSNRLCRSRSTAWPSVCEATGGMDPLVRQKQHLTRSGHTCQCP